MAVQTLIVDDSPIARRIIRHHLEQIGCEAVGEAENGAQGVKLFRELKARKRLLRAFCRVELEMR